MALFIAPAAHAAAPDPYYASFYPKSPRTATEVNFSFYADGLAAKGGWDFAGGDAFALSEEGFVAKHAFGTDGLHSVTFAAENDAAERGVGRLQIATHPDNWAPIVSVDDKDGVVTGRPVSISFDDYDDSPQAGIVFSYDLDGDGAFDDGVIDDPERPWSVHHTFTTDGAHTVKVKVDDGQGLSTIGTGTITTHTDNQAPAVEINGSNGGEVLVGDGIYLDTSYRDDYTESGEATYEWFLDGVELAGDPDQSGISVGPWESTGTHTVKVIVTDTGRQPGGENPLSTEVTYTVKVVEELTPPQAAPALDEVFVYSLTGHHEATPSFRTLENVGLSAYLPSIDIGTYAWDLDNDGAFDDATGYSTYFAAPNKGSYKVSVQASEPGKAPLVVSRTVVIDKGQDYAPVTPSPDGGGGVTNPPALTPEQQKAAVAAFLSKETIEFLQLVSGLNKKGIDARKAILVLGTLGPEQLPNGGTGKFDVYDKAGKLAKAAASKKRKLLGTTKVTLAKGQSKKVQVKLNKKGKALLKKKGKVKLTVEATLTDALTGAQVKQAKSYTFKVKKKKRK